MNISRRFIDHPIAYIAVMAAILLAGIAAFINLPVAALPAVEFPTIQVTPTCPGPIPRRWRLRWRRRWNASSRASAT